MGLLGKLTLVILFCLALSGEKSKPAPDSSSKIQHLKILSSQPEAFRIEFVPAFKAYYEKQYKKKLVIDWLSQGGTFRNVAYLKSQFSINPGSSGFDIMWGGGEAVYAELKAKNLLQKSELSKLLSKQRKKPKGNIKWEDNGNYWHYSAFSTFGIFFNKKKLDSLNKTLSKPIHFKSWKDLGRFELNQLTTSADPRFSSVASYISSFLMSSLGFQEGWATLLRNAANAQNLVYRSSQGIDTVVSGQSLADPTIDYFAYEKIRTHPDLGFFMPDDGKNISGDSIAILKGAPNREVAKLFLNFVLGEEGQGILALAKETPLGPKLRDIGRISTNEKLMKEKAHDALNPINPFDGSYKNNPDKFSPLVGKAVLNELLGAVLFEPIEELKTAWQFVNKNPSKPELLKQLLTPPLSLAELKKVEKNWDNFKFRTQKIDEWTKNAKKLYHDLVMSKK